MKPTFGAAGKEVRAAIIQIATRQEVFILDITTLRAVEMIDASQSQILLHLLFANPNVLKLGFSMKEDMNVVARSLPGLENLPKCINKSLDLHNLWTNIQSHHPSLFSASGRRDLIKKIL